MQSQKSSNRARYTAATNARRLQMQRQARSRILSRVPRSMSSRVQQWTLSTKIEPSTNTYFQGSSIGPALASWSFRVQDLPDFTSYSAIWDEYRMDKITMIISPVTQASNPASAPGFAPLVVALDFDDAITPTSFSQVLQYGTAVLYGQLTQPVSRSFKPKYRGLAYNGTTGVNASNLGGFLDLASGDVEHYGVKAAIRQSTSTNVQNYYIVFKYTVTFRRTR